MTFVVNGIQQKGNITTPLQLVLITDSSLLVRKLLEKYHILILSLKEYTQEPKSFGDVRVKIKRGFDGITAISNQNDINTVCELLLGMGVDVVEINTFSQPIPAEQAKALIAQLREKVEMEKKAEQEIVEQQQTKEKKIYSDPKLANSKEVIERIFVHIPIILHDLEGELDQKDIKGIHTIEEELKKLRMGNNYEKIRDLSGQVLKIMQKREERYFVLQQPHAKFLIHGSQLTDIDVAKEEMRQLYTQQRKKLGLKVSVIKEEYAAFGSLSLFRKFFQKDAVYKIAKPQVRLYHLYDIFGIMTGFLLSLTGFFIMYNIFWPTVEDLSGMRLQITKVGILGLLLFIGNFRKRKHIGNLILIYALTALAYRLLVKLIITNFAL